MFKRIEELPHLSIFSDQLFSSDCLPSSTSKHLKYDISNGKHIGIVFMISDELFLLFYVFLRILVLSFKVLWVDDTFLIRKDYIFTWPSHYVSIAHLVTSYFKAKAERNKILVQNLSCLLFLTKS
jgi:hypothetical protein